MQPRERIRKWLIDMQTSIQRIDSYLGINRDLSEYEKNWMLKRAVERELEIFGEAANRILAAEPNIAITDARKIVNLRNLIIHSYDAVADEIIWAIIHKNLPELAIEIQSLLENDYPEEVANWKTQKNLKKPMFPCETSAFYLSLFAYLLMPHH